MQELNRTNWPELREQILSFEHDEPLGEPRSYPGYACWPLDKIRPRLWAGLDKILWQRRCERQLGSDCPTKKTLSRTLHFAHGISADHFRGPVPSGGGLQALELYLALWSPGWLPAGLYHFDRRFHRLAQLEAGTDRKTWIERVPSLNLIEGGAILWILVGDRSRVEKKYGGRADRFLVLEAGHLMQNLCLLSTSLGWCTVPLGGFFEPEIARALLLPRTDAVLYVGVFGKVR